MSGHSGHEGLHLDSRTVSPPVSITPPAADAGPATMHADAEHADATMGCSIQKADGCSNDQSMSACSSTELRDGFQMEPDDAAAAAASEADASIFGTYESMSEGLSSLQSLHLSQFAVELLTSEVVDSTGAPSAHFDSMPTDNHHDVADIPKELLPSEGDSMAGDVAEMGDRIRGAQMLYGVPSAAGYATF